jgi:hypothetical protein
VLLQTHLELLVANDLTRIEGFVRTAASEALVDQLVKEVVAPMLARMDAATRAKVGVVLRRWASDPDPALSSAGRRLAE